MSELSILHGCATIQLTQGQNTLIDEQDWQNVAHLRWHAWRGKKQSSFYVRRIDVYPDKRVVTWMHRLLSGTQGDDGVQRVDHKNRDGLDNRRDNLRPATAAQNSGNSRKPQRKRPATSRFKGVCWQKRFNKWNAQINKNYKTINLGYFDDEVEAARAYNAAATSIFGEFAKINEGI